MFKETTIHRFLPEAIIRPVVEIVGEQETPMKAVVREEEAVPVAREAVVQEAVLAAEAAEELVVLAAEEGVEAAEAVEAVEAVEEVEEVVPAEANPKAVLVLLVAIPCVLLLKTV